jgi:hypothetical protein
VTDERIAGHLGLEEGRRSHECRIDTGVRGALRGGDRRPRRLASGTGDQRTILRHALAHDVDDPIALVVVKRRRFAVRSQDDETGERRRHPLLDVAAQRWLVE